MEKIIETEKIWVQSKHDDTFSFRLDGRVRRATKTHEEEK